MTCEEQLAQWVVGNSIHNPDRDECCPDFSCCNPKLKWSDDERRKFEEADSGTREKMLMGSLFDVLTEAGGQGYVTRDVHEDGE